MTKKKATKKAPAAPAVDPMGNGAADAPVPAASLKGPAFVSMSVSLPADLAARVRGLQTALVPGLELGLSEAVRYAVQLGLAAHETKHTLQDFQELDA